jgi:hypothetical protein
MAGVASKFLIFFYGLGVIASGYKPVERAMKDSRISNLIDFESLPYLLVAALLPLLFLMIGNILTKGKEDARLVMSSAGNQEITYFKNQRPHSSSGTILRNRDKMLLFYDHVQNQTILIPHSNVIENVAVLADH